MRSLVEVLAGGDAHLEAARSVSDAAATAGCERLTSGRTSGPRCAGQTRPSRRLCVAAQVIGEPPVTPRISEVM